MAAAVEEGTGTDALTDDHLGSIFTLIAAHERRSVPQVCKRWRRIFFSEPLIWREVTVLIPPFLEMTDAEQQDWFAVTSRQLCRVVAHVAAAALRMPDAGRSSDCNSQQDTQCGRLLQLLTAGPLLRSLTVDTPRSLHALGAVRCLRGCSSLTSLSLTCGEPCEQLTAALPLLTRLQRLSLTTLSPLLPTAACLAALTRLSSLCLLGQLSCQGWGDRAAGDPFASLTALQRLQDLQLMDTSGPGSVLRPPRPAAFAALQTFGFSCPKGCLELEGVSMTGCTSCAAEPGLVAGNAPAGRSEGSGCDDGPPPAPQHALGLVRARVTDVPLAPLLAALLPAGAALGSLDLFFCWLDRDQCAGCACLDTLTSLTLSSCSTRSAAALVQAAPALRRLALPGSMPESGAMPGFVAALSGITALSFRANNLQDLPPGPYLSELVHLDLTGNDFSRAPCSLAAASRLRSLSLESNERLSLSAADVEVLLALPALERLSLGPCWRQQGVEAQAALLALRSRIPEVRVV